MISKTIGCRGLAYFQTNLYDFPDHLQEFSRQLINVQIEHHPTHTRCAPRRPSCTPSGAARQISSLLRQPVEMKSTHSECLGTTCSLRAWNYIHWVGLKENLQETHGFLPLNIGFSCKFSHHPILWYIHLELADAFWFDSYWKLKYV